jgi:hypothetical protein
MSVCPVRIIYKVSAISPAQLSAKLIDVKSHVSSAFISKRKETILKISCNKIFSTYTQACTRQV